MSVINDFAGCFEAWYSHVASGFGARSSQRSATWRSSGLPSGDRQNACAACDPGCSSHAICGCTRWTCLVMSLTIRSSNAPLTIAFAMPSRAPGHHFQNSAPGSSNRLRPKLNILLP